MHIKWKLQSSHKFKDDGLGRHEWDAGLDALFAHAMAILKVCVFSLIDFILPLSIATLGIYNHSN